MWEITVRNCMVMCLDTVVALLCSYLLKLVLKVSIQALGVASEECIQLRDIVFLGS